ncbi:hypothetical protein D3C81_790340 [compost metagenome]
MAAMIWLDIATKPSWNACSVSVMVSASELRKTSSTRRETAAALSGLSMPRMNTPTWSGLPTAFLRMLSFRYS